MRRIVRISALLVLLTCPAYAGYIPNNLTDAPPPPPPTASASIFSEAAMSLLQTLLAI